MFLGHLRRNCLDFSNDSWTTRALLSGLDRRSIHSAVTRNICGKTEPSEQKAEANRPVVIVDSAFWQRRQLLAHMACQLGFAVTRTDGYALYLTESVDSGKQGFQGPSRGHGEFVLSCLFRIRAPTPTRSISRTFWRETKAFIQTSTGKAMATVYVSRT